MTGRNLLPDNWEQGLADNTWPNTWYWERELGYTKDEEKATWDTAIIASDSFWRYLEPLPGAVEALAQLKRIHQGGDHVFFITNRFGKLVREQTETFLRDNGFPNAIVVISGDKAPIINALGIDFFIDDKLETIQDVATKWSVKHLFLKDAPYNRTEVPGAKRTASISDALKEVGLWQDKRPVGRPKKSSST